MLALCIIVLFVTTVYGYVYGLALRPLPKPPLEREWTAIVSVLAGDGRFGMDDGHSLNARFSDPFGVAVSSAGDVYVADAGEAQRIRRIDAAGHVTTIAGSTRGFADGAGEEAQFDTPSGIAIGPDGAVYVADTGNNTIRRVTIAGVVSSLTPNRTAGYRDGLALDAEFNGPVGVAVDANGRVIVADTYNDRIRAIERGGRVTTIAGSGRRGYVDGPAADAQFDTPCGVAIDRRGNIFVADSGNGLIRRIDSTGAVTTVPLDPELYLLRPLGIAAAGERLYVTDDRGRVVEITPGRGLRVVAGQSPGFVNGPGSQARMRGLTGIAMAAAGRLIVADPRNAMVRLITARGQADFGPPQPPMLDAGFDEQRFGDRPLLWPIDPMDGPHEITGTQGEARGAETMGRFHAGLDVHADEGTFVRAIRDGTVTNPVSTADVGSLNESVRVGEITYVHVRAGRMKSEVLADDRFVISRDDKGKVDQVRVRRGARFRTGDIIGTVNPFNHVHLNVGWPGEEINPLRFRLPFFEDHVAPTITRVLLLTADGQPLKAARRQPLIIDQPVQIVVDAWDQVDGNEKRRRLGLYRLGYQVLRGDGSPIDGFAQPHETQQFDRLAIDPMAPMLVYASGSGIPFYAGHATHFLYTVTNSFHDGYAAAGVWDPRALAPGAYVVRVLAEDIRGNRATAELPVAVHPPQS